ncbi:hypothetical protein K438DRAFT_1963638 [Mycena galopus ATCC 62051]|nr:hypothetical protein K438DRAFT_1963638 [Mycena galopus ATCC 62051]
MRSPKNPSKTPRYGVVRGGKSLRFSLPPHPAPGTSRVAFIARCLLLQVALMFTIYDAANLHPVVFLSIVTVACRLSDPEEWPLLFGSPSDAYTILRLWRRAWHQLMRRFVSTHGKFLAQRVLKLRSGCNASAYVWLYTAFTISALINYDVETAALGHWKGDALAFFMPQVCAITLEDFVLFVGRAWGSRKGSRCG